MIEVAIHEKYFTDHPFWDGIEDVILHTMPEVGEEECSALTEAQVATLIRLLKTYEVRTR